MKTTFLSVLACFALVGCPSKSGDKADDAGAAMPSATVVTAAATAAAASATAPPTAVATMASAAASASAAPKSKYPTCAAGQVLGTEAMSPFKPFCGKRCKTDADCTKNACMEVNELTADGASNDKLVKVCNPDYAK